jgi:hypothetical protein
MDATKKMAITAWKYLKRDEYTSFSSMQLMYIWAHNGHCKLVTLAVFGTFWVIFFSKIGNLRASMRAQTGINSVELKYEYASFFKYFHAVMTTFWWHTISQSRFFGIHQIFLFPDIEISIIGSFLWMWALNRWMFMPQFRLKEFGPYSVQQRRALSSRMDDRSANSKFWWGRGFSNLSQPIDIDQSYDIWAPLIIKVFPIAVALVFVFEWLDLLRARDVSLLK